ncbi:hypothetical protein AN218_22925 [Streptomyces nanshensis]|uniref:ChrR-like cupin domain-containing protein n=1 Tax=Streptomyces nanshensis TaxID=518642 RepID=A0A1E7KZK5_9ACTN|nr:hypothetical protein AN218_22925 [Streptomyces nanshensis]
MVWGRTEEGEQVPKEARVVFQPGAVWPEADVHADSCELVIVIDGTLEDENGTYPRGTRISAQRGTSHHPRSSGGCTLRVLYPDVVEVQRPAPPVAEGGA